MRWGPSGSPVYSVGNSGTERLSKVPKDTQLEGGGASRSCVLNLYATLLFWGSEGRDTPAGPAWPPRHLAWSTYSWNE